MTNLLKRLRPEILESINLDIEKYPSLVANLKNELKENVSPLYLTVNTAYNLSLYAKKEMTITEIINFFITPTENEEE
jgi:hypothetical protein